MKTRFLILIGCIVTLGFTGIAFAEPEPEEPEPPTHYGGFICPPDKVFEWDICVDECRFGQIANSHRICEDITSVEITPVTLKSSLIPILIIISVSVGMIVIYIINRKRK